MSQGAGRRPAGALADPSAALDDTKNLLDVDRLSVSFATEEGRIQVVEDLTFSVPAGRTIGLVGESGCGKSVTAMSIMRLLPEPPSRVDSGRIVFDGMDLLTLDAQAMRDVRGDRIGMIFQEPMTCLNPTLSIGFQIGEVLRLHRGQRGAAARQSAIEMLRQVGVGAAERRINQFPHQLSGGLRQRVMIAMALVCRPALLIADEPTTALDVTIQAQILDLLRRLQREMGMAILMITHDLGVVAEMCDEVIVMYAGRVVERAQVRDLFRRPRHPYTQGLLAASPGRIARGTRLPTIPGMVPPPNKRGAGCRFTERCARALDRCGKESPPLSEHAPGHAAACWNPAP